MAQIKLRYSGEKQRCFCDAANDKALPFTKADLRLGRREKIVDDGPWVRAWLASCPDLAIVDEQPAPVAVDPVPVIDQPKASPIRLEIHSYKPKPKYGKGK